MKRGKGKNKGSAFERHVAKLFDKYWEVPKDTFWRTPNSGGWREVGDVYCRDKSIWFPFIVECKAYKTLNLLKVLKDEKKTDLYKWWLQVSAEADVAWNNGRAENLCKRLLVIKINNFPLLCMFAENELPPFDINNITSHFHFKLTDDNVILCQFSDFQKIFSKSFLEKELNKK